MDVADYILKIKGGGRILGSSQRTEKNYGTWKKTVITICCVLVSGHK